ncbi:MAG TPA: DUF1971 domain-containing protein [Acidimicrobiales bacterium]|nr:DUF1971 domain-containing protein [Acidimicrobiales bacterium]
MQEPVLPEGLELVRTTDVFDNESVPAGLLRSHRVASGVWGRLMTYTGSVVFVFEDAAEDPITVEAGESVVIPPARLHHVELPAPATFVIEFHRAPRAVPVVFGRESSGLADEEPDRS